MKRIIIVQAAVFGLFMVVLAGCSSGPRYQSYPPPPSRTSVSLILNAGPGMVISRYPNGRHYYRGSNGHVYWRGPDNRFYLDRKYINRNYYRHQQYNDWRRYHGRGR